MGYCKCASNALFISVCQYIGVCQLHIVSVCDCGLPLPLFQVEFRVLV